MITGIVPTNNFVSAAPVTTSLWEIERSEDRIHYITLNGHSTQSSDAILVESNGHFGLIDASNKGGDSQYGIKIKDSASGRAVVNYLMAAGVTHLDFILVTHAHSDHLGGVQDVANARLIENVTSTSQRTDYNDSDGSSFERQPDTKTKKNKISLIDSNTTYIFKGYTKNYEEEHFFKTDQYFEKAKKSVKGSNYLRVDKPSAAALKKLGATKEKHGNGNLDDTISFQFQDFKIQLYNLYSRSNEDENANSIVTYIEKNGTKTVLMADLDVYRKTEQQIAKYIKRKHGSIDVLKVGHHGFQRSTSKELLEALNPKIAIVTTAISSTANYSPFYGFLVTKGIEMYRTVDQKDSSIIQDMTEELTIKSGVKQEQSTLLRKENTEDSEETITEKDGVKIRSVLKTTAEKTIYSTTTLSDTGTPKLWVQKKKNNNWSKWYTDYDSYDWVFVDKNGLNKTGWVKIKGRWFEFDESGLMKTGWTKRNGKKVFLLKDNYQDRPIGSMMTGWYEGRNGLYYFESSGAAKEGWAQNGPEWCYCISGKAYNKGWKEIEGSYYFFGEDYFMKKGWIEQGERWFYCDENGIMLTGDQTIDGVYYHFANDGHLEK